MPDTGHLAFRDTDANIDPVTRDVGDLRFNPDTVFAPAEILPPQLLLHLVEYLSVEYLSFCQANSLEGFGEVIRADVLVALQFDGADGGTLLYHHDQGVAALLQPDILEKSGFEQGANGIARQIVVKGISHLEG